MRLFGFEITRTEEKAFSGLTNNRGGWLPIIRESFAGAWQQNVEIDRDTALTHFAVFACMTLLAGDISKLRVKLMRQSGEIKREVESAAFSPVLRKPNGYQTRIQYWEHYILSKLANGNVYVLKRRDNRGVVTELYVLDPRRVMPLVAPSGEIFYRLDTDDISHIEEQVIVPASEIIHDRFNCIFHPLVGLSPLTAAGLAAMQGIAMQQTSTSMFQNGGRPGGILTAPGAIADETAQRLKAHWDNNYSGDNVGKVAVLGDGLKFETMTMTATDSQLIEQMRWTAEIVCAAFHVPPWKIGIKETPPYANGVQAGNVEYYSTAVQKLLEDAELALNEGLGLDRDWTVEFETADLLRMDSLSQIEVLEKAVGAGVMAPNEARARLNLGPVEGGDRPYLQQQNYSLEALAKRDSQEDPFETREATRDDTPPVPEERSLNVYRIHKLLEAKRNAA